MKILNKEGIELVLFDSIKELPISRYNVLNKVLIQDVGFGSTFQDAQTKLQNLNHHIQKQNWEDSKIEISNLFFSIFSTLEKTDIKSRLFLCFVQRVGDYEVGDADNEEVVQKCFVLFDKMKLTIGDVDDTFSVLKKKLISN